MLLQPLDYAVGSSLSIIIDGWLGLVLAPELKRWEPRNLHLSNLIQCGVKVRNQNIGVVRQPLSSLVIMWCKRLAMSTPWRIELYEDLLVSVEDVLGEGFADEDLDMAGAFDGGLGGFQEPAYCAGIDAIDKRRYAV